MKQALNMMGAMVTPQAIAKAFGTTLISHPEMPPDKLFFVDAHGEVVAVIVNIGQPCLK
jgi:hypothetical protein